MHLIFLEYYKNVLVHHVFCHSIFTKQALEKLQKSNDLRSKFATGDENLFETLDQFKDSVDEKWKAFEDVYIPHLFEAVTSNSAECSQLLALIVQRNQTDLENFESKFYSNPRFLEDKFNDYFVDKIAENFKIGSTNIQKFLKHSRNDLTKLLQYGALIRVIVFDS